MRCHNCGTELRPGAKFCDECGEQQNQARMSVLSDQEIAEIERSSQTDDYASKLRQLVADGIAIERRDVAVLFIDVSGFMPMSSALPIEQVRQVMRDVYSVMSGAITRCGGYVDKFIGDEVMAIFGAPISLERPCERAITAVDETSIGLVAVNHRFAGILPVPLAIHAGITFGAVEAGRFGESRKLQYTFLGQTVNVAKRLTDMAPPGAVFVSAEVEVRASGAFEFTAVGEHNLAGSAGPTAVFQVAGTYLAAGERPRFSKLAAPMFGRDDELDVLTRAFSNLASIYPDAVCSSGRGDYNGLSRIFGLRGDAGIGKSRLIREFKQFIFSEFGGESCRWLSGCTYGIGQTPLYWPIKMQIASALGFDAAAKSETIGRALRKLEGVENFDAELVSHIYRLFGLQHPDHVIAQTSPTAMKDNLWIAIRRLFAGWAMEAPLVLVFEDMHWADRGTADFVDYLADFTSDFPVLVLLLYRPEYEAEFANRTGVPFTELRLSPLSGDAESKLLSFYVADGRRERTLIRRLRRYSDGNPLFAEEFLLMLLERGKLEFSRGKLRLTEGLEAMPVPTSLSEVLGERFDRLPQRDKRVAYYGAVIGRAFLYRLLSDIHSSLHGISDIRNAIDSLSDRDILLQKAMEPELEYVFKHAATRQILVSRLVESLRRELSKLVAMRTEELYKDRIEGFHGMLSEHWETAGETESAARHAALCGIHNQKLQRNLEAQDAFERFDRLCGQLDSAPLSVSEQSELLLSRIAALGVLGRWNEAVAFCESLHGHEDGKWRGAALSKQARLRAQMGDYALSLSISTQALDLARQTRDKRTEADSLNNMGIAYSDRGDFDQALRCYGEALSANKELGDRAGIAMALLNMASVAAGRGDRVQALQRYEEALSIYRELHDRRGIAAGLNNMGWVHWSHGEYDQALTIFEQALSIKREIGDRAGMSSTLNNMGNVLGDRGDVDRALHYYEQALLIKRELGNKRGIATALNNIGLVHCDRGRYDEALRCFEEALSLSRDADDRSGVGMALSNIAWVRATEGEWVAARTAALQADELRQAAGFADYAPEVLSTLCWCDAALGNWADFLSREAETCSLADELEYQDQMVISRLGLAKANLEVARWFDRGGSGEPPPLSRAEAISKAAEYCAQARELAESKGMRAYMQKADALSAELVKVKR